MSNYAHPEYLVETDWVAEHLNDPKVRIIESDEDPLLYKMGHVPGAVQVDWFTTLQHPLRRDFLTKEQFESSARKPASPTTPRWSSMATSPTGSPAMRCGCSSITVTKMSRS